VIQAIFKSAASAWVSFLELFDFELGAGTAVTGQIIHAECCKALIDGETRIHVALS